MGIIYQHRSNEATREDEPKYYGIEQDRRGLEAPAVPERDVVRHKKGLVCDLWGPIAARWWCTNTPLWITVM